MQQWLYLNFTRNSFYILFPTKGNVSYRQVISIRLYVCLKQWFPTFSEASSLCSFRNFLFLPYYTIFFFIPPLLHESAEICDLPIYSFSPDFYLSRCSLLFGFVD